MGLENCAFTITDIWWERIFLNIEIEAEKEMNKAKAEIVAKKKAELAAAEAAKKAEEAAAEAPAEEAPVAEGAAE